MFVNPAQFIKRRVLWANDRRKLNLVSNMEEFEKFLREFGSDEFRMYRMLSHDKRLEYESFVDRFNIDLSSSSFLDVGPGYGDALDIAFERGSPQISFIERNPVFFKYNELKGYAEGYSKTHLLGFQFAKRHNYSFIWAKGSIIADRFMYIDNYVNFTKRWVMSLESLARPNCHIMLCPYWLNANGKRNVEDVAGSKFSVVMMGLGYEILTDMSLRSPGLQYPVSYYKLI
jgi:hypothetical protein